jgi:hypothetical protein
MRLNLANQLAISVHTTCTSHLKFMVQPRDFGLDLANDCLSYLLRDPISDALRPAFADILQRARCNVQTTSYALASDVDSNAGALRLRPFKAARPVARRNIHSYATHGMFCPVFGMQRPVLPWSIGIDTEREDEDLVLLGIVAARVLAGVKRRRSEEMKITPLGTTPCGNEIIDLREETARLSTTPREKREAEAEAPASCAGREESPAMGKGEAVIGRPRL